MKQSIKFFCTVAAFLGILQMQAQVKVNPKVGVHTAAIEADLGDMDTDVRAGWNAGLDFRVGRNVYFSPGIHFYSTKADLTSTIDDRDDFRFRNETQIQSLKAPLNVGIKLLGLRAYGGVTPTYILGTNDVPDFTFDTDNLNRLTWGGNLGVGLDLLFLTVDATYEIGLTDYFKEAEGSNNVFSLSVGLKF